MIFKLLYSNIYNIVSKIYAEIDTVSGSIMWMKAGRDKENNGYSWIFLDYSETIHGLLR